MNKRIRTTVEELLFDHAEALPAAQEWVEKHEKAVKVILDSKMFDRDTIDYLENGIWQYARVVGETMLEWGLRIGQNPAAIADLPDCDNVR